MNVNENEPPTIIAGKRLSLLIANCHVLLQSKYGRSPLWSMVSGMTGYGSGYSIALCKAAGFDPHQGCNGLKLKPLPPESDTQIRHGVNCQKVPHVGSGYLHDAEYDRPYDVDGMDYCGRCHRAMDLPPRHLSDADTRPAGRRA